MQNCELVDVLTQPGWAIAIGRVAIEHLAGGPVEYDIANYYAHSKPQPSGSPEYGYRCWVFTPDFTVLDDGEVHHSPEAAADSARRLVLDSR
ncbi:MAG: hypothetical protein AAGM45_21400, partial [Cyanobacteria bacterium J06588_5]